MADKSGYIDKTEAIEVAAASFDKEGLTLLVPNYEVEVENSLHRHIIIGACRGNHLSLLKSQHVLYMNKNVTFPICIAIETAVKAGHTDIFDYLMQFISYYNPWPDGTSSLRNP